MSERASTRTRTRTHTTRASKHVASKHVAEPALPNARAPTHTSLHRGLRAAVSLAMERLVCAPFGGSLLNVRGLAVRCGGSFLVSFTLQCESSPLRLVCLSS
jgi:hypothetical protein